MLYDKIVGVIWCILWGQYNISIFYVQDMKMLNDTLTTKALVEILTSDDPKVTDEYGSVNLELEVCFSLFVLLFLLQFAL